MKTDTLYVWSQTDHLWKPEVIYKTFVDENDRETDYIAIKVHPETGEEEVFNEWMHVYDKEGRLTLYQEMYFKENRPSGGHRQSYKFGQEGNMISNVFAEWDTANGEWKEKTETVFSFHDDIPIQINENTHGVIDFYELGIYNFKYNTKAVSEVKVYHIEEGVRKFHERLVFYYSKEVD